MSATNEAPNLVIRHSLPTDTAAMQEIASHSPEAAQWPPESYLSLADYGQTAWVAELAGAACGFLVARASADEAEILNLAIDPARRRAGFASALVSKALGELQSHHVHSVFLEVRESNHPAIQFYRQQGFAETGRRESYYKNPSEAAVLMVRKLTG